jgi:hypothetical protein
MDISRNGPAAPGDPFRRAEGARAEHLIHVRARAVAAREDLERHREILAEKTRAQRGGAHRPGESRSGGRASRRAAVSAAQPDRVEISDRAKRLASGRAGAAAGARGSVELEARVRRLAELHREGSLASPERLDRAARRMLGDER